MCGEGRKDTYINSGTSDRALFVEGGSSGVRA